MKQIEDSVKELIFKTENFYVVDDGAQEYGKRENFSLKSDSMSEFAGLPFSGDSSALIYSRLDVDFRVD